MHLLRQYAVEAIKVGECYPIMVVTANIHNMNKYMSVEITFSGFVLQDSIQSGL